MKTTANLIWSLSSKISCLPAFVFFSLIFFLFIPFFVMRSPVFQHLISIISCLAFISSVIFLVLHKLFFLSPVLHFFVTYLYIFFLPAYFSFISNLPPSSLFRLLPLVSPIFRHLFLASPILRHLHSSSILSCLWLLLSCFIWGSVCLAFFILLFPCPASSTMKTRAKQKIVPRS